MFTYDCQRAKNLKVETLKLTAVWGDSILSLCSLTICQRAKNLTQAMIAFRSVVFPSSYRGTERERLQHLKAILHSASVCVQVLLYSLFVLFCHVLFVLFCVLLYCLMHASVCISSSEALTSLTSSQHTLIEINSFDQLVTKTYPRLRRFNR